MTSLQFPSTLTSHRSVSPTFGARLRSRKDFTESRAHSDSSFYPKCFGIDPDEDLNVRSRLPTSALMSSNPLSEESPAICHCQLFLWVMSLPLTTGLSSFSLDIRAHTVYEDEPLRTSFRNINVPTTIDGDFAWYLLHANRYMKWRLDIHIDGDRETLLSTTNSLTYADCRFRVDTPDYPKYSPLVYANDIQSLTGVDLIDEELPNINKPPSQRRVDYCKVFFNCDLVGTHNFLSVQPDDIPLLPF
ncbi:hypothetical protein ARMSODRAFT_1022895 [Armillaria solidipes]|uniref:Uncharacterized protein n=1 Tax=Armillaria solidipes TaxID=1076256 RepID=A0A2H3B6W2_9AGAR|nr:hypothetical protein ARMSODRAFT_1022895 [Armillaria solidipes]